jgi:hypothetical protein
MSTTKAAIDDFVAGRTLAVVGISATAKGFGYSAYQELKKRGYRPMAVHPSAGAIGGERCWPNLAALPEPVERVLVVVKPDRAEAVVREAAQAGCRHVWLQQGADSPAAIRAAEELGLGVVYGHCILMFAGEVGSVHAFHKWLWKVLGKIPA